MSMHASSEKIVTKIQQKNKQKRNNAKKYGKRM